MNVQLFIPCFVDQLYPDTAFNMIKVLEKAGCVVSYNTDQTFAVSQPLTLVFGTNQRLCAANF
jgi:L-lactate dehydrogenase complex protein LldE